MTTLASAEIPQVCEARLFSGRSVTVLSETQMTKRMMASLERAGDDEQRRKDHQHCNCTAKTYPTKNLPLDGDLICADRRCRPGAQSRHSQKNR